MLDYNEHILPYKDVIYIKDSRGYIAWRAGTGMSAELLHIAASEHRQGYGKSMFTSMISQLAVNDTHTVYGFTRARLIQAQVFYTALGFRLKRVPDLYADGDGVMFHQSLYKLLETNNVN